jgi:GNAT superfamily N-acetyltransferase
VACLQAGQAVSVLHRKSRGAGTEVVSEQLTIRPVLQSDYANWLPLWMGYNAFYGRSGPTALADAITQATWLRFFNPAEPVRALVAQQAGQLIGFTHYIFHRSTTRLNDICYLQDLFTAAHARGRGVGKQLIEAVYVAARNAGSSRVYWQTQSNNETARALYDKLARHHGFIVYSHEL